MKRESPKLTRDTKAALAVNGGTYTSRGPSANQPTPGPPPNPIETPSPPPKPTQATSAGA